MKLKRTNQPGVYHTEDGRFEVRHVVKYPGNVGYWHVYEGKREVTCYGHLKLVREWLVEFYAKEN